MEEGGCSSCGVLFAPFEMRAVVALRKYIVKVERRSEAWHLAAPLEREGDRAAAPWTVAWVRTHTMGLGLGIGCYPPVASKWIARVLGVVHSDAKPNRTPSRKLFGFPSLARLSNKAALTRSINATLAGAADIGSGAASDGAEMSPPYYPRSWVLPRDVTRLQRYLADQRYTRTPFILKPSSATQGDGIRLLSGAELLASGLGARLLPRELATADGAATFRAKRSSLVDALGSGARSGGAAAERGDAESWVVQRYLERPLLTPLPRVEVRRGADGGGATELHFSSKDVELHKFDLRLYVLLVAGADVVAAKGGDGAGRRSALRPGQRGDFKAFLFVDGLVRICAEAYSALDMAAVEAAEPAPLGRGEGGDGRGEGSAATDLCSEALLCAHLTNSHLNARSPKWDAARCKLTMREFVPLIAQGVGGGSAPFAEGALWTKLCALVQSTVEAIEPEWRAQLGTGGGGLALSPPPAMLPLPPSPFAALASMGMPPLSARAGGTSAAAAAMEVARSEMGMPPSPGPASAAPPKVETRGAASFYIMGFDAMLVQPTAQPTGGGAPTPVLLEINSKPKLSPAKVRRSFASCAPITVSAECVRVLTPTSRPPPIPSLQPALCGCLRRSMGRPQGESVAMRAMRSELISSALAVATAWRTDEVGGGAAAAAAISGSFVPCFACSP